jgi:hypothetical protein
MAKPLGRPPLSGDKMDSRVSIPLTREQRDALLVEARKAGYRSLAEFIRERKLLVLHEGTRI